MLSILHIPIENIFLHRLVQQKKKLCKQDISDVHVFFGTRIIFIRAMPKIFCSVNGAKSNVLYKFNYMSGLLLRNLSVG